LFKINLTIEDNKNRQKMTNKTFQVTLKGNWDGIQKLYLLFATEVQNNVQSNNQNKVQNNFWQVSSKRNPLGSKQIL
jgi:hypothetical protein